MSQVFGPMTFQHPHLRNAFTLLFTDRHRGILQRRHDNDFSGGNTQMQGTNPAVLNDAGS